MELSKIVVGLDFAHDGVRPTSGAKRALEVARWLATEPGTRVTLVHSMHDDERWHEGEASYVQVARLSRSALDALLEAEIGAHIDRGAVVEMVTSDERPDLAITREVLRTGADVTIVGKRAECDADGRKLGNVSMKLLRECPGAVWVAKPGPDVPPITVLAATDLGPVGTRALRLAAEVAAASDAELHVVHAFGLPLDVQLGRGESEAAFTSRQRSEGLATLEAQLASTPMAGRAELHVTLSSPSHAVVAVAERICPDLVVMGTVARKGIPGLLLGNTAERLLGRLDSSILVVKPEDFVCPVTLDASRASGDV